MLTSLTLPSLFLELPQLTLTACLLPDLFSKHSLCVQTHNQFRQMESYVQFCNLPFFFFSLNVYLMGICHTDLSHFLNVFH